MGIRTECKSPNPTIIGNHNLGQLLTKGIKTGPLKPVSGNRDLQIFIGYFFKTGDC